MSIFLEKFQQENVEKIHIIQLDNAPIHTAKKLKIPGILWFFRFHHAQKLAIAKNKTR